MPLALARGFTISSTHDTALRFLPPLIVERKHVDIACETLDTLFTASGREAATPVQKPVNARP